MAPPLSRDDKIAISGGIIGFVVGILLILLSMWYERSVWQPLATPGLNDPTDPIVGFVGYDDSDKSIYLKLTSGAVYSCPDQLMWEWSIRQCEKVDLNAALQHLKDIDSCDFNHLPTAPPPGKPKAYIESYPCPPYFAFIQVDHVVLADGSIWRLRQEIAEDEGGWMAIAIGGFGFGGLAVGMIGTAILITLSRKFRHTAK